MLLFAALLAWFTWQLAIVSFEMNDRATGIVDTPLFIPQCLMALGFTVFALEALVLLGGGVVERVLGPFDGASGSSGLAPPLGSAGIEAMPKE
jgi:TRAP-type C4-dicarboxylate transport system permease small subunit